MTTKGSTTTISRSSRRRRRQITKRAFQIGNDIDRKPSSGKKEKQFLASTPKPGKTQLSRRRPISSVQESEISEQGKSSQRTNALPQSIDSQMYELSHHGIASESAENLKRKSLSRSKLSETNESSKRFSSGNISNHITSKPTLHSSKSSAVTVKNGDHMNLQTEKIKRKQKDSSIAETQVRYKKQNLSRKKNANDVSTKKRESDIVPSVAAKKRKVSIAKNSAVVSRSSNLSYSLPDSSTTVHMNKNKRQTIPKKTADKKEKTPEDNDFTVVDISVMNNRKSQGNKTKASNFKKPENLKQSVTKVRKGEKNIPVQTVMVYQDRENHKKSDLMDLDIALSTMTQTIQTQVDDYDIQKGQSAGRLLEKYLVQDISRMISDMHKVKKLQGNVRKGRQSLKERQKTLMSLQIKRSELLVSKNRQGDEKQSAGNMKDINAFLENMKSFIEQL